MREVLAGVLLDQDLVVGDELLEDLDPDMGVGRGAGGDLGLLESLVEGLAGALKDDASVHRDEATV